jgi:hypothetical protein
VDALAQKVEQVELDAAFHAVADERWANIRVSGKTVAWDDAKAYLLVRAKVGPDDERRRKPTARKIGP